MMHLLKSVVELVFGVPEDPREKRIEKLERDSDQAARHAKGERQEVKQLLDEVRRTEEAIRRNGRNRRD